MFARLRRAVRRRQRAERHSDERGDRGGPGRAVSRGPHSPPVATQRHHRHWRTRGAKRVLSVVPSVTPRISPCYWDRGYITARSDGVEYLTRWQYMAYNHPWYVLVPQNAPDFRRDRFINNNSLSTC